MRWMRLPRRACVRRRGRGEGGSLTIMVGGEEKAFERAKPVFEKMGKNITLVGRNGVGQTTKVANQIVVALTIEAVAEALVFASKAGADPAKVRQALMGGLAASRILEVHGERMIKRTFAPGFRIELHQKDLNLALEGAKALGVSLPNTSTTQQLFNSCAANGGAKDDHSGLVKALEGWRDTRWRGDFHTSSPRFLSEDQGSNCPNLERQRKIPIQSLSVCSAIKQSICRTKASVVIHLKSRPTVDPYRQAALAIRHPQTFSPHKAPQPRRLTRSMSGSRLACRVGRVR